MCPTFHPGKPASALCALLASTLISHVWRQHPAGRSAAM
jgi:hypothetical protein